MLPEVGEVLSDAVHTSAKDSKTASPRLPLSGRHVRRPPVFMWPPLRLDGAAVDEGCHLLRRLGEGMAVMRVASPPWSSPRHL